MLDGARGRAFEASHLSQNGLLVLEIEPYGYLVWAPERLVPHKDNRGRVASDLTPAAYKAAQEGDAE